jgi:hypothetical protein
MSYSSSIDPQTLRQQQEQVAAWLTEICDGFPDAISWAIALEQVAGEIRRNCAEKGESAETK